MKQFNLNWAQGAPETIAVGLSGGVDSACAATLLLKTGIPMIGVYLRLWHAPDDRSAAARMDRDIALAGQSAARLGIPFHVIDAAEMFHQHVIKTFLQSYASGQTPNPCIHCNMHIKWGFMLDQARELGASHLATGHYARLMYADRIHLMRAIDRHKDQSYVLSFLTQQQFQAALFPLGEYSKQEVRALAHSAGIQAADRPESQDLCFVGDGDYRDLLRIHAPHAFLEGPIVDVNGVEIGLHQGLGQYTIGQRKGIGIALAHPLYVIGKDFESNTLFVGPKSQLGRSSFSTGPIHWVSGEAPAFPLQAVVRTRYTASEVAASFSPEPNGGIHATLSETIPDITPGQAAVLYQDDECLGGGLIQA
ncbi:MAG: tRNA 2-thiouridine(34) synthase MnmA [Anaerolineales bacterium]|nr:tRNA 2-thiouridine(34) synthase MnmA [Anaerolineales bacterium]